ncbi:MAG: hypothetical protein JWL63_3108 [Rhodocyclales bacterium]|nr:hypothetical protein [Rhodocyclales bacterium]
MPQASSDVCDVDCEKSKRRKALRFSDLRIHATTLIFTSDAS